MLAAEADAVVCVSAPEHLLAVGAWYDDFSQVGEREVLDLLAAG
jgi:putative phosphoribosyl transferase